MSGGHFDYREDPDEVRRGGGWRDREVEALVDDLFGPGYSNHNGSEFGPRGGGLLQSLDFWLSGDTSEEDYRDDLKRFKDKWFRRTPKNRVEFYKQELRDEADKILKEFEFKALGVE